METDPLVRRARMHERGGNFLKSNSTPNAEEGRACRKKAGERGGISRLEILGGKTGEGYRLGPKHLEGLLKCLVHRKKRGRSFRPEHQMVLRPHEQSSHPEREEPVTSERSLHRGKTQP